MYDIGTLEELLSVIRLWFGTFLCDHIYCSRHDLEYDSLHMFTSVSTFIGEFLVVDRMYRSSILLLIESDPWAYLGISVMIDVVLGEIMKVYQ